MIKKVVTIFSVVTVILTAAGTAVYIAADRDEKANLGFCENSFSVPIKQITVHTTAEIGEFIQDEFLGYKVTLEAPVICRGIRTDTVYIEYRPNLIGSGLPLIAMAKPEKKYQLDIFRWEKKTDKIVIDYPIHISRR